MIPNILIVKSFIDGLLNIIDVPDLNLAGNFRQFLHINWGSLTFLVRNQDLRSPIGPGNNSLKIILQYSRITNWYLKTVFSDVLTYHDLQIFKLRHLLALFTKSRPTWPRDCSRKATRSWSSPSSPPSSSSRQQQQHHPQRFTSRTTNFSSKIATFLNAFFLYSERTDFNRLNEILTECRTIFSWKQQQNIQERMKRVCVAVTEVR